MEAIFSPQAWLTALLIFFLRVSDMSLDTLRVLYVMRGKKILTWVLGFAQSAIFVAAITSVLKNLDNPLSIIGYAAGFASGNVVGMWIEESLAIGYTHLRIISPSLGQSITERLRQEGFAVTEVPGRGKDGIVTILIVNVRRKRVDQVQRIVNEIDSQAFITAEDIRSVRRGFWRA